MSLLLPGTARTDEAGMKKSHIVYTRFANAKKALCIASSKGKAEVMAAAKEFGLAKDEYDNLPNRAGILGGKSRRRKTRGRRRKTRGGDDEKPGYRDTNPSKAPSGAQTRGTEALANLAARANQARLASTPAVGGPSPGASTPPPPTPSFSSFLAPSRSLGVRNLVNNFLPKASPSQENPQDVARRNWCHAKFEKDPRLQLMCFQQAPDDVSDTNPWSPPPPAGRRRITRRR